MSSRRGLRGGRCGQVPPFQHRDGGAAPAVAAPRTWRCARTADSAGESGTGPGAWLARPGRGGDASGRSRVVRGARWTAGLVGRLDLCRAEGCASSEDGALGGAEPGGDVADGGAAGVEPADDLLLFGRGEVVVGDGVPGEGAF